MYWAFLTMLLSADCICIDGNHGFPLIRYLTDARLSFR